MSAGSTITVLGGTGYLGRHVVAILAQASHTVRVAVRHPQPELSAGFGSDQVRQQRTDVREPASVAAAIGGATAVVNAVGLYVERGDDTFHAVHVDGARRVAEVAAAAGARLVHISGIGASETSRSRYVRARAVGERLVQEHCADAVILRPSVLFGENDKFLSALAGMVRLSPVVPLFGDGSTRLQPVYVTDVATAVARVCARADSAGRTYELGGPNVYTYRELIEALMAHVGRRRFLLPVPFPLWEVQAAVAALLPRPPLTRDQVELMRYDNTVSEAALGFRDLSMEPQPLETLLPQCVPR